ncbi:tRNA lysidine(34) synthetase TilS [Gluconobacter sp. Dm-62]|uniref:tRNA lysidine(34) synthetase TilS n=1 Tax=Gluconobacter sp. Dm-62 TaxID=2799804 RepID=UPI001B8AC357|nr:tRNA lysidine(34) synthetase TilS [Gluconobacter sp. Dm-62]MBS1102753.1 tRNA lysidine(34) synthetase TilS [Gluconobacter sp. Dm-62]
MAQFGPWPPDVEEAPVALAVSGGADSTALALLARRWRRNVLAFVVDHALRSESAAEARLTIQRLADMGVKARLLTLEPFPKGRLQERARQARFEALEAACVAEGCLDLLVAHHAGDQDETVWMRSLRASGPLGLSGIQPVSVRGRIRLVRPLLSLQPDRLRKTLQAENLPWIEDPSNANRRFERVRWRQDLTPEQRRDADTLQIAARQDRQRLEGDVAANLARYAVWHAEGWVFLEQAGMGEENLSVLLRLVSGKPYRPAREAVQTLLKHGHGTLSGVQVRRGGRFGDGVILVREENALEPQTRAGVGAVWDGRWRLLTRDVPQGALIGPLGDAVHALDLRRLGLPYAAARCLPGIWHEGQLVSWPCIGKMRGKVDFVWAGGVPATGENHFRT